jgi:hypothetical protein
MAFPYHIRQKGPLAVSRKGISDEADVVLLGDVGKATMDIGIAGKGEPLRCLDSISQHSRCAVSLRAEYKICLASHGQTASIVSVGINCPIDERVQGVRQAALEVVVNSKVEIVDRRDGRRFLRWVMTHHVAETLQGHMTVGSRRVRPKGFAIDDRDPKTSLSSR